MQPGTRIRFSASPEKGVPFDVPLVALTEWSLSRGKSRTYGASTGALWTGAIFGALSVVVPTESCDWYTTKDGGVVSGAIGGALIGRERWNKAALPARVGLRAMPDGPPAVVFTVAW